MRDVVEVAVCPLNRVIFDESIYPRARHDEQTVEDYAEALGEGAVFPPVVLEAGTDRLLDGRHRWLAHARAGLVEIDVKFDVVPAGMSARVYAAKLSMKHGLKIGLADRREVARAEYLAGGEQSLTVIAKAWGVLLSTVSGWVGDLREAKLKARRAQSVILNTGVDRGGPGWTQKQIADKFGIDRALITREVTNFRTEICHLSESAARCRSFFLRVRPRGAAASPATSGG